MYSLLKFSSHIACLPTERTNVCRPGNVQDRKQSHKARKSPYPGLHGRITRYSDLIIYILITFLRSSNSVFNVLMFVWSNREPLSRAGWHHSDQTERTHRDSTQSRWNRQHHHAGGHSVWNELLYWAMDPPQEIQTHYQRLLRRTGSQTYTHLLCAFT